MNNRTEFKMQHNSEEESIDLKKVFTKIKEKGYWFVISLLFCFLIAFFYTHFTAPLYQINARLLVNDDQKGGGLGKQSGALMDLGGLLGSTNSVDNEAEILKTRFLMEKVVRQMKLNIIYERSSNWLSRELLTPPFELQIISGVDTVKETRLELRLIQGNKIRVKTNGFEKEVSWNEKFSIKDIGNIVLIPNLTFNKGSQDVYYVTVNSIDQRVTELMKQLSVGVSNKQVTIIDMGLSYALPGKGEQILNTLINQYTEANVSDKNAIADSTYKFIRQRISVIASELGDVEDKQESFKKSNKLANMTEQSKLLVQSSGEYTSELAKAETQVSILSDLETYLKDETKNKRVFPTSLLPQDMVFSGLMGQYNSLLIERDKQLLSVTEQSPFIVNIDTQIAGLRRGILSNIQSTKNTYVVTRNKLKGQIKTLEGQIEGVPQIEKDYLKLSRNQQIKQELYVFLMQKAEETAISKTSNISIAKVIDPPKSEVKPVSPKKSMVYLIAFISGLVIPIIVIFTENLLNTAIITKEDVNNLTQVPVIGEISRNLGVNNLVVANQDRSAISEQFRALRTNLSFYLKSVDENVILLTSSMSGEGKSFTSINLGNILALAGKKVLLMELDLRKPGLSAKLNIPNVIGFSNFTINPNISLDELIKPLEVNKNLFLMSSGPLPPNPAETLMNENTSKLIKELKKQFDYIIMDAPPVGIITDAQLLSQYASAILYVVRQKVTQKDQLSIVEDLYQSGKMKNIGIVVNDITSKEYGYGYGYGNYGEQKEDSFFKKILNGLNRQKNN